MKVACLNPIAQVGLKRFGEGYELDAPLEQAEVALVRSANLHETALPSQLLAIGRAGAGVNNIPLERCAQQGIVVFNTPGANANAVKELVLAGMLLCCRDLLGGMDWVHSHKDSAQIVAETEKAKKQFAGFELVGKRLGIVGLGNIGIKLANAAVALGMEVWGYTLPLPQGEIPGLNPAVRLLDSPEELYAQSDFISLHLPLLADNAGMISQQVLDTMKPNAVLLNFSRDKLVDEEAVVRALQEGKLGRYVTDFPNPTVAGAEGVLVLPHLGASTQEAEEVCACMAVDEIKEYVEQGNLVHSVNFPPCSIGEKTDLPRICVLSKGVPADQLLKGMKVQTFKQAEGKEFGYLVADLAQKPELGEIERLESTPGVIRVRLIP